VPKQTVTKTSFSVGEVSPRLYARVSGPFLEKREDALKTCTNSTLTPHGPVFRRPGTKYVAEVKDSDNPPRLGKYQINNDISYVLEIGDEYCRFYRDGGRVESGGVVELTTPWGISDVPDLQWAQSVTDLYVVHPEYEPRIITRTSDTVWSIGALGAFPPPTYEAGFEPAHQVTPGAATGIGVTFTASGSSFAAADEGRQIVNLSGPGRAAITGITSTTVVTADIVEDFPNTSPITAGNWKLDLSPISELDPDGSKAGTIITITADDIGTTNAITTFRSSDVGRFLLLHGGVVQITSVVSGSEIKAEVIKSLDAETETSSWSMEDSTWNDERGWPKAVTFFEGRLIFGGTISQPSTTWWSEAGIFDGFGVGPDADDSLEIDVDGSRQSSQISWMAGTRTLAIGTTGAEATLDSSAAGKISPENEPETRVRTFSGSDPQQVVEINDEVLFIQRAGTKLQSFRYNLDIDNYGIDDLMIFAEHIADAGITYVAYAREPDSTIYAVLTDGSMLVGTYIRDQKVLGWSKWTTEGEFKDVQVISEDDKDNAYFLIKRTVNGSDVYYIEILETGDGTDRTHVFSDSGLVYSDPKAITNITKASPAVVTTSGAHGYSNGDDIKIIDVVGMTEVNNKTYLVANATSNTFELTNSAGTNIDSTSYGDYISGGEAHELVDTISGLSHLEGETVQVKTDGGTHPDKVVISGSITLDYSSYEVTVGLPYTTTIETLDMVFNDNLGVGFGQDVKWVRPVLYLYNSTLPTVNDKIIPARSGSNNMDQAVPLFTGPAIYGPYDWGTQGTLTITTSSPLPMQLLGIFGTIDTNIRY